MRGKKRVKIRRQGSQAGAHHNMIMQISPGSTSPAVVEQVWFYWYVELAPSSMWKLCAQFFYEPLKRGL